MDNTKIEEILEPPEGQDEGVWKYEHLRFISYFFKDSFYNYDHGHISKIL